MSVRVGVDIGGTVTDFALLDPSAAVVWSHKNLTTPDDPSRAVVEGLKELLRISGHAFDDITVLAHGTTLVTNAVIERKGAVTGMVVTEGFADVIDIARETRYEIFDLRLRFAEPVVPRLRRAEVPERMAADGTIRTPLDEQALLREVARLVDGHGIRSLAICFLNSFRNPESERSAERLVRERFPNLFISVSSAVANAIKEYERWSTTLINAYTQPLIDTYLASIESQLARRGFRGAIRIMTSSGGSFDPTLARRFPVRLIESGPAAGILMSSELAAREGLNEILAFDMGGTTAKGAFVRNARPIRKYEMEVAREHHFRPGSALPVSVPVIDMIEIGSGGGSIARVDRRGLVNVGPDSASSVPGPACYGLGGVQPTLTDAHLTLGVLDPGYFLGGRMRLAPELAVKAIRDQLSDKLGGSTPEAAAAGVREIAAEDVAAAFRTHAAELGLDVRKSVLVAFGGSGPLIATLVARKLRISDVLFPAGSGVFSAIGLLSSPASFETSRSLRVRVSALTDELIEDTLWALRREAEAALVAMGVASDEIQFEQLLDLRYKGQGHQVRIAVPERPRQGSWAQRVSEDFLAEYARTFSSNQPESEIEVTDWRVIATEVRRPLPGMTVRPTAGVDTYPSGGQATIVTGAGATTCPKLSRYALQPGQTIAGPALIQEVESTCVLLPGDVGTVLPDGHIRVRVEVSR